MKNYEGDVREVFSSVPHSMDPGFHGSVFSSQFNTLKIWGAWPIDTVDPIKRKLFWWYSVLMVSIVLSLCFLGVLDFFDSLSDFRRVTWNLCINSIVIGTIGKNVDAYRRSKCINRLRRQIHRSPESCKDFQEMAIYDSYENLFRNIMKCFHYPLMFFLPVWVLGALYWYIRTMELPIPLKWPFPVGPAGSHAVCAFYFFTAGLFLFHAMTGDLGMFGLLVQINREYEFLLKDIDDLNKFCQETRKIEKEREDAVDGRDYDRKRINQMKIWLGRIVVRQKEIIQYTADYEQNFNQSMLIQIFVGGFAIIINCLQTLTLSLEFHVKTTPQGAYVAVIAFDLLVLCLLGNRNSDLCQEIGGAMYNMPWYTMDVSLRRDILLILLRSQKPPRITSGRILDLNMETYSETLKNIYRWMAVFRQIGFS